MFTATVDRFEEDKAVIRFDDGQELVIDGALLPEGTAEGARVNLNFTGNQADETERVEQARAVLNEILQGK